MTPEQVTEGVGSKVDEVREGGSEVAGVDGGVRTTWSRYRVLAPQAKRRVDISRQDEAGWQRRLDSSFLKDDRNTHWSEVIRKGPKEQRQPFATSLRDATENLQLRWEERQQGPKRKRWKVKWADVARKAGPVWRVRHDRRHSRRRYSARRVLRREVR